MYVCSYFLLYPWCYKPSSEKKKNLMGKFLGEPLAAIAHTFPFKYKSQGTLVASNFLALSVTSVYDSLIVDWSYLNYV